MTVLSFALAFVGFCALIVLHELGHFTAAKLVGMRVERFSLFFPPILASKTIGETEYSIGATPLGGYVKISGMSPAEDLPDEVRTRAYYAQPVWKRIVVIAAGPAVNLVLAFFLLLLYFGVYGPTDVTTSVGETEKTFPAAGVLRPGDRIVSVDYVAGGNDVLRRQIESHRCAAGNRADRCVARSAATIVVDRKGVRRAFNLRPVFDAKQKPPRMRLGFGYQTDNRKVPFSEALDITANRFWFVTRQTVSLPAKLIHARERKQLSGLVGTYETTRQAILDQPKDAIAILALISLSLAIVNLFPFLPLDGGHIFWAIVELVRRRPVPFHIMERSGVVGVVLVLLIFFIGLTNDVGRLLGDGFSVR